MIGDAPDLGTNEAATLDFLHAPAAANMDDS